MPRIENPLRSGHAGHLGGQSIPSPAAVGTMAWRGVLNNVFEKTNGLIERVGDVVAPVQSPTHELHIAIRRHDWARTEELLRSNYLDAGSLNQMGGVGGFDFTPLHVAAEADFVRCVEYLIAEGADVDVRDRRTHETPLHKAAKAGASRAAKCLVERGASVVARDGRRGTAYDVCRDLGLRQWLLPLQLRAEQEGEPGVAAPPPPMGVTGHAAPAQALDFRAPPVGLGAPAAPPGRPARAGGARASAGVSQSVSTPPPLHVSPSEDQFLSL